MPPLCFTIYKTTFHIKILHQTSSSVNILRLFASQLFRSSVRLPLFSTSAQLLEFLARTTSINKKFSLSNMPIETELSIQSLPINKIPKYSVDWVVKALVIRRGSIIPYRNARNEGSFRTIILIGEEGTKIQATLFNKYIQTWKDLLKPNKSYYIANGRLNRVNPNYSSVYKEFEFYFTNNTIVKESVHDVLTNNFFNGFVSLEHVEKLSNGTLFDLVCILLAVNPIIEKGNNKRREIIDSNESQEKTTVTLWGDFTVDNGAFMEKLKDDKPILGLCDVRVSIYKGESFYKFKVTILKILNKDEPGFSSCNKCHKIVQVIQETASCSNCSIENVDYEIRYSLRLQISDGERRARVILFEAARFFHGYNVKEYIESTSVKKEESRN
ncbi:hypothetical protein P3S68_008226 [Capsicum galapagoense]